jgi:hypothetical protein
LDEAWEEGVSKVMPGLGLIVVSLKAFGFDD